MTPTGQELYCASFSLSQWIWLQTPTNLSGVNTTGTSCDPRVQAMSRSPDGYLLTCQTPSGANSPYMARWQHFTSMLE